MLGAWSELTLWHADAAFAQRTIRKVRQEIERYERSFSLYRPDSEIARLNAAGRLAQPSPELLDALSGALERAELAELLALPLP